MLFSLPRIFHFCQGVPRQCNVSFSQSDSTRLDGPPNFWVFSNWAMSWWTMAMASPGKHFSRQCEKPRDISTFQKSFQMQLYTWNKQVPLSGLCCSFVSFESMYAARVVCANTHHILCAQTYWYGCSRLSRPKCCRVLLLLTPVDRDAKKDQE